MTDERPTDAHRDDDDVFVDASAAWESDEPWVDRPGWVKPVGIISIVWGAIGLFCGVVGIGGTMLMRQMQQSAAGQMQGGFPDVMLNPPPAMQAVQYAGLVWAGFLILCGGLLLARKPVARPLHLLYAVVGIALSIWGVREQLQMQIEIQKWVEANPDTDFARATAQSGNIGNIIGLGFALVLGMAWPLFCLVWFGLVKRKPTDITGEGGAIEPAA